MVHRPSKIDRLPVSVRDLIKELRENGRTIDEILGKLHELDVDVSRSGLGRHIQGIDVILANVHQTYAMAEVLAEQKLEDKADNRLADANVQAMHSILMRLQMAHLMAEDGKIHMDAKEAMFLSTALNKNISSSKLSTEEKIKLRDQIKKEEREKAAKVAGAAVKKAGISDEARRKIEEEILGLKR